MPRASKKPCGKQGCPNLVTDTRYCSQHTGHKDKWRGSSHSRGYDSDWRRTRLLALARDFDLCQQCKRDGRLTPATCVDHIQPIQQTPDRRLDLTNLQSLCTECHSRKTVLEDRGFGRAAHKEKSLMFTINLIPDQFAASKLKVEEKLGKTLSVPTGTITYEGVTLNNSYNGTALSITIAHKPMLVTESYIESNVTKWFSA